MITAETITDTQIRQLRQRLFDGPADDRQLHGLVACHDGLGRSHRRANARAKCAELWNELQVVPPPQETSSTKAPSLDE